MLPKKTVQPSKVSVRSRVAGYVQASLAGVSLFLFPPAVASEIMWLVVSLSVAMILAFAGAIAAIYAPRYRYREEYVCLWAIITCVAVLALSTWFFIVITGRLTSIPFALLLGALACKYIARAGDLRHLMENQNGVTD